MKKLIKHLLIGLYAKLRDDKLKEFERVLPNNELLSDRWEKATYLGFGENCSIYDSSYVFGKVKVGEKTWIGPNTILDGSGELEIGSNCSISAGVQIYSHSTVEWAVSGGAEQYKYSKTIIGDNCYLGPNSIVAMGVELGSGTIVGASSFYNKSFPSGSKVAGCPARIID